MIHVAGLLHDVGKIGVSDKVLLKAGALTPEEVHQIREHPALGERIMRSAVDPEILSWVRAHHERWDGNGYPDGLMAEHIPLEARILAVCDSFDAMRSDRTYRRGMSIEQSLIELQACSGSQFDPELVVLLEEAVRGQRRTFFEALAHPGQGVDHLGVAFEAGT
jgi:HD-GYP domain-containing protein (c-di-GMP phosphodiesterase class II)